MLTTGDQLRPSELQRSLNMRLQNLWTAVARSSHSIQVLFAVHTPDEVDAVNKAMAGRNGVQCMPILEQLPATNQGNVHYFKLFKQ